MKMIWETSLFNRLYKSKEYKFHPPDYLKLSPNTQKSLESQINNEISEFNLNNPEIFGINLKVNKKCNIYHLYPNNNTYYFSYITNLSLYYFYKYISYGREILKKNENNDMNLIKHFENYFMHLIFLKEFNFSLLETEIKNNLNNHFKFYNYILNQISYFDIMLLSLIIDSNICDEILSSDSEKNKYIKRWFLLMQKVFEINREKLVNSLKIREKEYLYNTYKFTSCTELVENVLSQNYEKVEFLYQINTKMLKVENQKNIKH